MSRNSECKVGTFSPGAGGDLVAMKGPQGFSFFFMNYMYIDNLEPPGVVLVKKHNRPSGPLMATGSWSTP